MRRPKGGNIPRSVKPNGSKVWRFVGPNHWEDGPTVEGCIASAIHEMARSAHKTY